MAAGAAGLAWLARHRDSRRHSRSGRRCASGAQPGPRLALPRAPPRPNHPATSQPPDDDAAGIRARARPPGAAMTDCDAKGEREPPIGALARSPGRRSATRAEPGVLHALVMQLAWLTQRVLAAPGASGNAAGLSGRGFNRVAPVPSYLAASSPLRRRQGYGGRLPPWCPLGAGWGAGCAAAGR